MLKYMTTEVIFQGTCIVKSCYGFAFLTDISLPNEKGFFWRGGGRIIYYFFQQIFPGQSLHSFTEKQLIVA